MGFFGKSNDSTNIGGNFEPVAVQASCIVTVPIVKGKNLQGDVFKAAKKLLLKQIVDELVEMEYIKFSKRKTKAIDKIELIARIDVLCPL